MLADYVNGAQSEKVPFVFMPVKGQLINANAEIALSGNQTEFTLGHKSQRFGNYLSTNILTNSNLPRFW